MKAFLKKFSIILSIIFITSSIAVAGIPLEEVSAFIKNTKIKIQDNSPLPIKTILYKGNIYIPLEAISKMNCSFSLDAKNNTIILKNNLLFKDFKAADPWNDEIFAYGEIRNINKKERTITIEQHFDDNSISIEPDIKISENIVIIIKRNDKKMNLDFNDLRVGDIVGVVLTKNNIARGMIINN
ncbi:hypothetical protein FQB35_03840 [Crassaminicella thermophila]|uniref:Copper amine oxidase N-terminal domain-containing protein n=1 Tax=Crassaminicella thermophila TaxID=2599308 RepID=A0A5C0SBL9_CRATE|nr:hypothetical protein [Crassaminicella thermophila]QEK11561.1 hypothetical protein FQB35_03840 [Crassaminicella thermophila]